MELSVQSFSAQSLWQSRYLRFISFIRIIHHPPLFPLRNILVLNLALSDLLAALTLPFTAMDALWQHWPLPSQSLLSCRYSELH